MKSRHNDTITSSSRSSSSSHHKHASLLLFVSPFFFLFFSSFSFPFVCIISVILNASPSIPTPFPPSLCFCVPHRHYTCIEIKSTATKTKKTDFIILCGVPPSPTLPRAPRFISSSSFPASTDRQRFQNWGLRKRPAPCLRAYLFCCHCYYCCCSSSAATVKTYTQIEW